MLTKTLRPLNLAAAFLVVCGLTAATNAQDTERTISGQDAINQDDQALIKPALPTPQNQMIEQGQAQDDQRPMSMGVSLGDSAGGGVLITSVQSGSPAFNAGLVRGDYIMRVGEITVSEPSAVNGALASQVADDRIRLQIWRDARPQEMEIDFRNAEPGWDAQTTDLVDPQINYTTQYRGRTPYRSYSYRPNYYYDAPTYWYNGSRPYRYNTYYGRRPGYYGNGVYVNRYGGGGVRFGRFGVWW